MNVLIQGCPLEPCSGDLIAQTALLEVGKPVPKGWRVLSGNERLSTIARVAYRFEIEAEEGTGRDDCGQCEGTGTIEGGLGGDGRDESCPVCDGTGRLPD